MKRSLALLIVLSSISVLTLTVMASPRSQTSRAREAPQGLMDVVINELAWSGTACSAYDEWIELYNNTEAPIDLGGWVLQASDGTPRIELSGTIAPHSFFLLERTDDSTVSDLPADLIYTGALDNTGEALQLLDAGTVMVDSANADGGAWPGGLGDARHSMERIDPTAADSDANWGTNDGLTRNGLDCNGAPLNGTPKAPNSLWTPPGADLKVHKLGPATVFPDARITYTLAISNAGSLPAEAVRLTDVLPAHTQFLTHTAPYPFSQPAAGTLVWELGTVTTATARIPITFTVTGWVDAAATGELVNIVTGTTTTPEAHPGDNHHAVRTAVGGGPAPSTILIEALYYDGYANQDHDEAFRLINVSSQAVDIGGWDVIDPLHPSGTAFPPGTRLAPGQAIWCAWNATDFQEQFGFKADFETGDTDPEVPEMDGAWPTFANNGGGCLLRDEGGKPIDALVYLADGTAIPGWTGLPVVPWSPNSYFGTQGQILYRKRDQRTGMPLADTDTAADWAQDPGDQTYGRKAQYPGWDLDAFFHTARVTETAALTVAVSPDHLLETILPHIQQAQKSIWIEGYTFESGVLAQALIERLAAGVTVTMLLEGGPVGGIDPAQRWICRQISDAAGQVYFMVNDPVPARYRFQHAKVILIDDRLVLIGSENLNPSSLPADDKGDGTAGRRGVYLITDAPGVVSHIQALLAADIDPAHHQDLATCTDLPDLCTGTPPWPEPEYTSYTVAFSQPLTLQDEFAFEVIQSPENSLRTVDGLLGLVGQAGSGDTVLVEMFYEYVHWGRGDGTPEADPNLRLEACLGAARRGARIRILLNSLTFGDYQNENVETVTYLRSVAQAEGLDLQAQLANPTYLGLHNKMILAEIHGRGYVHVGSINGSEVSSKVNRELALQVQSDAAYRYLREVFDYDWAHSQQFLYLPLVERNHRALVPADHLLISELLYARPKDEEWVEILNPASTTVDLSGIKIGDAEGPGVYEGMYQFPPGTRLGPGQVLVIATSAAVYRQTYGRAPQFEFYETDPAVPTLTRSPSWGTGEWELRNAGDEVLLLDGQDRPVDVVVYGDAVYPDVVPHPGVTLSGHSLERYPPLADTDDCSQDFRDWPFPNPGEVPIPVGTEPPPHLLSK